MISLIAGVIVIGAAGAALMYSKPRNGQVQWFVEAPILEWVIPIAIVGTLAVGIGLVMSGVTA
jgi:hypothetical protein